MGTLRDCGFVPTNRANQRGNLCRRVSDRRPALSASRRPGRWLGRISQRAGEDCGSVVQFASSLMRTTPSARRSRITRKPAATRSTPVSSPSRRCARRSSRRLPAALFQDAIYATPAEVDSVASLARPAGRCQRRRGDPKIPDAPPRLLPPIATTTSKRSGVITVCRSTGRSSVPCLEEPDRKGWPQDVRRPEQMGRFS